MLTINLQEMIFSTILRKRTYFILENNLKNESIYVINSDLVLVGTLISVNICTCLNK